MVCFLCLLTPRPTYCRWPTNGNELHALVLLVSPKIRLFFLYCNIGGLGAAVLGIDLKSAFPTPINGLP